MKMQSARLMFTGMILALSFPQASEAVALSKAGADSASAAAVTEAPPTENPACLLAGTVRSVEENVTDSNYYDISIELNHFTAADDTGTSVCNDSYASRIEKAGQIMKAADLEQQALQEGDAVEAQVRFDSDGKRTGYFLSSVKIVGKADAAENTVQQEDVTAPAAQKKDDSFMTLLAGFTVTSLVVLVFVVIASRKRR